MSEFPEFKSKMRKMAPSEARAFLERTIADMIERPRSSFLAKKIPPAEIGALRKVVRNAMADQRAKKLQFLSRRRRPHH